VAAEAVLGDAGKACGLTQAYDSKPLNKRQLVTEFFVGGVHRFAPLLRLAAT
jgi:hypothetical protein